MSQASRRFRSSCDRLTDSRLEEQYEKLSTTERFAVLGGSAVAVLLVGELLGSGAVSAAILAVFSFGIFTGLTKLLARRHE